MRIVSRLSSSLLTILAVLATAAPMQAGIVSIKSDGAGSTEGLGAFTGSFDYAAINATSGTLTINLTNTSPADNSGFITAFAFNNPLDLITAVSLSTNTNLSTVLGGPSFNNTI